MDEIVVSFDGRFGGGQAFVALSRARSLTGLHIINLDTNKIKVNKNVEEEMDRLRNERTMALFYDFFNVYKDALVVSVLNIRSFPYHKQDLINDPIALHYDVIVLTETWLNENNADFSYFATNCCICRSDKLSEHDGRGGGVALLVKKNVFTQCAQFSSYSDHLLQILTCQIKTISNLTMYVIGVYNSPTSENALVRLDTQILAEIREITIKDSHPSILITGDFNQSAIANPKPRICQTLSEEGFRQYVSTSTHLLGSILDHMYLSRLVGRRATTSLAYYCDHSWVSCGIEQN